MARRLPLLLVAGLVGLAAVVLLPLLSHSLVTLLSLVLAKGIVVLGIIVLLQAGQVSFGHAMFFAAGAYAVAFYGRYVGTGDILLYLVFGAVSGGVLGLVVGLFVVRYREIFFGMLNLAFSMVLWSLLEKMFHYTNGADGIRVARPTFAGMSFTPEGFSYVLLYLSFAIALAALFAVQRYLDSPLGHMLRAIKTQRDAAGISRRLGPARAACRLCDLAVARRHRRRARRDRSSRSRRRNSPTGPNPASSCSSPSSAGRATRSAPSPARRSSSSSASTPSAQLADAWQMILGGVLIAIILLRAGGADRVHRTSRPGGGASDDGNSLLSAQRARAIRFGGVIAADGVDLDVIDGEHLAIIGPNGAGKTTFLNIATGYLKPQAGTRRVPRRGHHGALAARHHPPAASPALPDSSALPRPYGDREAS